MHLEEGKSHQLPSSMVEKEFGEINVKLTGKSINVLFTILMEPTGQDAEGWRTGVALDASISMKWAYGQKLEGNLPKNIKEEYKKKGWISSRTSDGVSAGYVKKEAINDAIKRGLLKYSENVMEKLARDFISYLAENLDAKGKTTVAFWACGKGDNFEVLGEFDSEECKKLEIKGPKKTTFGKGTKLFNVLKYFADIFRSSKQSMSIFLTDGKIEDFEEIKNFTIQLAKEIESGVRNPMKCVLIGVGDEISVEQMEELDDLETGTDVDIWDHKIAKEMRTLLEIFAEVVNENQIVAPTAAIYDDKGKVVKRFNDGLPAMVNFNISSASKFFELEVGEHRIRQKLV